MENLKGRALFNLLQMNYAKDPSLQVEAWQVEDYRQISLGDLFLRLQDAGLFLDKETFIIYSEKCDTPEDLTDLLIGEEDLDDQDYNKVYLLIFELWRRLLPQKQSLSIFCDELDHLINAYDNETLVHLDELEDALALLQNILDENTDFIGNPVDVFCSVAEYSAHDLESFLFDFIADQIDTDNLSYAEDLLEGFYPYMKGKQWFDLLNARILAKKDPEASYEIVKSLVDLMKKEPDLEFILEMLAFLVQSGDGKTFIELVHLALPLLSKEEELVDLLSITSDYYRFLDIDDKVVLIEKLLNERKDIPLEQPVLSKDPVLEKFRQIIV